MIDLFTVQTLREWQSLVGVIVGAFVGSLMSLIGFYMREKFSFWKDIKEGKRRVEVSETRTINDMYDLLVGLQEFILRVRSMIAEIDKIMADNTKYYLEETNFPPLQVFRDETLPNLRTRSYYVHNKVLWADAGTIRVIAILQEMKMNFSSLSRKNEFLVGAVAAKQREQKETYKANLEDFLNGVEKSFVPYIHQGIEVLMQIKVYNSMMRGRRSWFYKWKYEGVSFKYFKNRKEIEKYNEELDCIDRIDGLIADRVNKNLEEGRTLLEKKIKKHLGI